MSAIVRLVAALVLLVAGSATAKPLPARVRTRWPATSPCARFDTIEFLGEAGRLTWSGTHERLELDFPKQNYVEMALVGHGPQHPLDRNFPASALGFVELSPPQDSFTLVVRCSVGAVRWYCLHGACVTSATFPAEQLPDHPPSPFPGRQKTAEALAAARGELLATISAACAGARCSKELTGAADLLRAAPRESVRRVARKNEWWFVDGAAGGLALRLACSSLAPCALGVRRGARTLFTYQSGSGSVVLGDEFDNSKSNPDRVERERTKRGAAFTIGGRALALRPQG